MRNVFFIHHLRPDSFLWDILAEGEVVVVPTKEMAEETRSIVRMVDRRCLKDLLEADPTIDLDHARNQSVEVRTSAQHQAARLNEVQASGNPAQAVPGTATGRVEVTGSAGPVAEQPVGGAEAVEANVDDAGRKECKDNSAGQDAEQKNIELHRLTPEERKQKGIDDLEPESGAFAWSPKYDFDAIASQFPTVGKFEENTYRPSAVEMMSTMIQWTATIQNNQLVMEKHLGGNATAVAYTTIMVGEIAGGTRGDSIRVVRRDETPHGAIWFANNQDWVARQVPVDCDTPAKAVRHLVNKIEKQVGAFTRDCPDCAEQGVRNKQVLCNGGKGRDATTWWRGLECSHSTR